MKVINTITLAALLFTANTLADNHKSERLSQAKAMAAENIDAKISLLNDLKSCISGANDRAALKNCRSQAKAKRQSLKESSKSKRKEWREKRKKMREERKAARQKN